MSLTKKATNIKTNFATILIDNKIKYAMHLQCVIGSGETNSFSALSKTTATGEKDDSQVVNTILYVEDESVIEISPSADTYPWFRGDDKVAYNLPPTLSQAFRDAIVRDMKTFKGLLGFQATLEGINTDVLTTNALIKSSLEELVSSSAALDAAIIADKKLSSNVGLDGFIERYAFRQHALITGPRGVGKTYKVTEYAASHGAKIVQLNAHAGIEATDILGYNVRASDGSFVWLDGPLSQAFRIAQTEPVILVIDELLRTPIRELNIFISALTPNSSKQFLLNTSRITEVDSTTGIGTAECLVIPKENLWVVATTNMGADYDVDDMDLAFNDRFRTFDVVTEEAALHAILLASNPNSLDEIYITKLMQLNKAILALVVAQELAYTMNTRHLTGILDLVTDPKELRSYLFDLAPNICSRQTNGSINTVELEIFKNTVKSIF